MHSTSELQPVNGSTSELQQACSGRVGSTGMFTSVIFLRVHVGLAKLFQVFKEQPFRFLPKLG